MKNEKKYAKILALSKKSVWHPDQDNYSANKKSDYLTGAVIKLQGNPDRKKGGWYKYIVGHVMLRSKVGQPVVDFVAIGEVFCKLLTEEEFQQELQKRTS